MPEQSQIVLAEEGHARGAVHLGDGTRGGVGMVVSR